jgi:uncharacterized protein (TIGR02452 family)
MSPKRRAQMVSNETAQLLEHWDYLQKHQGAKMYSDEECATKLDPHPGNSEPLRTAIIEGDIIDVAIDWQSYRAWAKPGDDSVPPKYPDTPRCWRSETGSDLEPNARVLLLNAADDRSPGGEWIEGTLGPEEELARRSNLVKTLDYAKPRGTQYSIPRFGGIYSPRVTIFREGPEQDYATWGQDNLHALSVLSITPARRPKVQNESPASQRYAFAQEREEQKKKMKVALRIAAKERHVNLCLNGFGCSNSGGPESTFGGAGKFRNPLSEVINLWYEVLYEDDEFKGYFRNIVIAVQPGTKEMWQEKF